MSKKIMNVIDLIETVTLLLLSLAGIFYGILLFLFLHWPRRLEGLASFLDYFQITDQFAWITLIMVGSMFVLFLVGLVYLADCIASAVHREQ